MLHNHIIINHETAFEQLAQFAIEKYYLIPYPNKPDMRPDKINRYFHGAVHVVSVVNNVEIFIQLYERYAPHLLAIDGRRLADEEMKLIKLAAIYHDVANINEAEGTGSEHAKIFRNDMLALGFNSQYVDAISDAIIHKDGDQPLKRIYNTQEKIQQLTHKNIYQKLLQSADCLDIVRVVRKLFDVKQLDIYFDLGFDLKFINELHSLIEYQIKFLDHFNISNGCESEVHKQCELSPNCYLTIKRFYEKFKFEHEIKDSLGIVRDIISQIFIENTSVIDAYQTGIIVRIVDDLQADIEIAQENKRILAQFQLDQGKRLKAYLTEQEIGYTKVFTPDHFKWRPATLIRAGLPIPLYGNKAEKQKAFIILHPNDPTTHALYFYKKNVVSNATKSGDFTYTRTIYGRAKDKETPEQLIAKLEEMNQRRLGLIDDPGLHYYGKNSLEMGEILLSSYQNIMGIGVCGYDQGSAEHALKMAGMLRIENIKFYRYIPEQGLSEVPPTEISAQAQGTLGNNHIADETSSHGDILAMLNANPALIKNIQKINLQHAVQFKFFIQPDINTNIDCLGYVSEGQAVIRFTFSDGVIQTYKTALLPMIAEQYYREQLFQLTTKSATDIIAFNLLKKNGKLLLSITLTAQKALHPFSHVKLESLLLTFGKFTVSKFPKNINEIVITTSNLSLIEALQNIFVMNQFSDLLMRYISEGNFEINQPEIKKYRGSKYPRLSTDENQNLPTSKKRKNSTIVGMEQSSNNEAEKPSSLSYSLVEDDYIATPSQSGNSFFSIYNNSQPTTNSGYDQLSVFDDAMQSYPVGMKSSRKKLFLSTAIPNDDDDNNNNNNNNSNNNNNIDEYFVQSNLGLFTTHHAVLNQWQKLAFVKYQNAGLKIEDLLTYCTKPPFIQAHLDLMNYFFKQNIFSPLEVLKELDQLPLPIVLQYKRIFHLGIRKEDLKDWMAATPNVTFYHSHASVLEYLIVVKQVNPKNAIEQIKGFTKIDADEFHRTAKISIKLT